MYSLDDKNEKMKLQDKKKKSAELNSSSLLQYDKNNVSLDGSIVSDISQSKNYILKEVIFKQNSNNFFNNSEAQNEGNHNDSILK